MKEYQEQSRVETDENFSKRDRWFRKLKAKAQLNKQFPHEMPRTAGSVQQ